MMMTVKLHGDDDDDNDVSRRHHHHRFLHMSIHVCRYTSGYGRYTEDICITKWLGYIRLSDIPWMHDCAQLVVLLMGDADGNRTTPCIRLIRRHTKWHTNGKTGQREERRIGINCEWEETDRQTDERRDGQTKRRTGEITCLHCIASAM